ncbi:hypothetical protein ABPG74_000498 [Tetrahymena malaccensis]
MSRNKSVIIRQFLILLLNTITIKCVGCPFWQIGSSDINMKTISKIILLKSNPQNQVEDIAAIAYQPFNVGIFNLEQNKQYQLMTQSESVTFYQMDKDDRRELKVSVINTLDANGRVIQWNSGNGSRVKVIQIPSQITVNPNSCLNSQEMLVITWDSQSLFIYDFSSSNDVEFNVQIVKLLSGNSLSQCLNDNLNRRFLITNKLGTIFSYDIQTKQFFQLFTLNQFSSLQSIFPSQNQIAISYQQISGQSYIVSYRNSSLVFQQPLYSTSTQILVNKQEDQIVVIGNSNLFQIWNVSQNKKIYQPNFQKMYCDQRDANQTSVDALINFTFGSINQNDEIAVVSNNYIFAYSISQKKPLVFKSQNFKINLIQSFVHQNKVILNQQYSVANFDLVTSKYLYMVQYSFYTASGGQNQIVVFDYRLGVLIDRISNPFTSSDSQGFILFQDKTNRYLIGFIKDTTSYMIYKFDDQLDHSLVFKGILTSGGMINGPIAIIESSQQILVKINGILYLYNYFYQTGTTNQFISFQSSSINVSQYFFIQSINQLIVISENLIQVYQQSGKNFQLLNSISYYTGLSSQISLVQEQQIIILNRGTQLYLKSYKTLQENLLDFNDQPVLMYTYDGPRALLVAILANFKIEVINITQAKVLYFLQLDNNALQMMDIFLEYNLVVVSYQNGQVIYYNYITNSILSIFNNQFFNDVEMLDKNSNSLVLKSNLKVYTRRMTNLGLIYQVQENLTISSYYIDIKSGLSFSITNQVKIFNYLTQQYFPSFINSLPYLPYIIFSIPSQNLLFLGFSNLTTNLVFVYRLNNYQNIGIMDHNITFCYQVKKFYHDVNMNRSFIACQAIGTVAVWDLNNNFTLIQYMMNLVSSSSISNISFNPKLGLIIVMGLSWWSSIINYNTLNYQCQVVGIYSDFDYTNQYLVTWDQNGDFRIYDQKCTQLAYRHCAKSWINQLIIDEQQMIITTISQDNKVKTYNYQILPTPALLNQLSLSYQLSDGFLDKENGYLLVADFNGYLYMISYPTLILQKTIQVTFQKINNVYLDKAHNLFLFVSQAAKTISYYNLIEFLQSNAFTVSFRNTGIMSTLNTQNGIIFHQQQNMVQIWDYQKQSLRYGFFVNSQLPLFESQSQFKILEGQNFVSALITREQTIFFNLNTFDIINVQSLKCLRSTQLKNYFICSQVNVLTILNLQNYIQIQSISLRQNSSVIQLQSILELNMFFVTTSLGEVICFTLNSNLNIFQQQLYSQLLTQAIANYCLVQINQQYIILASSFDGQIGQLIFQQQLNIISQQQLFLPGICSHAHIIIQYNNSIFIKRILDFSLALYDYNSLTQINIISSPCIGYSYKLDLNQEFDLIIQSCIGNYQINKLTSLQKVATGRYIKNLNLTDYVYTPDCNQIIFISKDYFIDAYFNSIYIYQINYISQIVNILGNFQLDGVILGNIAAFNIFKTQDNTYIQLVLYSQDSISQVQLPIFGENQCEQSLSSELFGEAVLSIQSVYQQIQTYFKINSIKFNVIIDQETILLPFPSFLFSAITQINVIADNNSNAKQKIIVNEDIFFSFQGYNLISLNNLYIEPANSQNQYLLFYIQNITTFQLNNIQLGDEKLFSFNFNYIQNVEFDQLSIQKMTYSSQNMLALFNFQQVNQIIINNVNISQSNFSQVTLFYFQNDVNNNLSLIQFQDLQIQQSQFLFSTDSQNTSAIFITNCNKASFNGVNINQNQGTPIPMIKSYVVSNLSLNKVSFVNNQEIQLFTYKSSISQVIAKVELDQKIIYDNIIIQAFNISNNQYSQFSQYSTIQINSINLIIQDSNFNFNTDKNSSNSILNLISQNMNFTSVALVSNRGFQNLFVVKNTNGNLQNLTVQGNQAAQSILIFQSKIFISESSVLENESVNTQYQNSVVNILQNSNIILTQLDFEFNKSFLGGSIYVSQSDLQIQQTSFKNDFSLQQGGSIYSIHSTLSLSGCSFNNCSSILGGCIYLQNGNIQLNQIKSSISTSAEDGGFLYANSIGQFALSNLELQNCKAFNDGGCIYMTSSGGTSSFITQTQIQNSRAFGSGGAILLDNTDLSINKSKFINNTAGIGGAIRYLNLKPLFLNQNSNSSKDSCKTYSQNFCQQNKAIIFGNSIASYPQYASILPSNQFNVNIDHYPNVTFSNFRSGMSNFDFSIQFLDEFKNLVKQVNLQNETLKQLLSQKIISEISQYTCKIQINEINTSLKEQNIKIDGAILVDYAYHGENKIGCLMNNFKLTGIPKESGLMSIQLNGMKTISGSNQFSNITDINVNILFRECQVGEYYAQVCEGCQLYECVQCLNGTYSLEIPKIEKKIECKYCDPSQTNSCYLNQIVLKQNYWRVSSQSDQIYPCYSDTCDGNELTGYCSEGYVGALCQTCDNYGVIWGTKYGQSQVGSSITQCVQCDQISKNLYKQILIFLFILLYLVFLIIESQNNNCKMCQIRILSSANIIQFGISQFILQSSVISKIFINQFQILTALKQNLQINLPDLFSTFLTFPQIASQPVLLFFNSLDCSLSSIDTHIPIQYLRFIYISILLPLVFLTFIYIIIKLIIIFLNYINSQEAYYAQVKYNNFNMLISALIVFTYLASQNIYQAALQVIFCQKFDNLYYMKSQMDYECYTQEHIYYIIFLVLPVLILVTVIYPLIMLIIMCKNSSKLFDYNSTNVIRRYGYFFQGYKKNRWWWEFIKTEYKFIALLLSTYFVSQPINQLLSIIYVQLLYCSLLIYFSPYQDNKINSLELKSSICTLLIFQFSLFIQLNSSYPVLTYIASVILIIIMTIQFSSLAINFLEVLVRRNYYLILKLKCLISLMTYIKIKIIKDRQSVKQYLLKNSWLLYNLFYKKNYNPFAVFNNWKKLRNIVLKGELKRFEIQKLQNRVSKQNSILNKFSQSPSYKANSYIDNSENFSLKGNTLQNNENLIERVNTQDNSPNQYSRYRFTKKSKFTLEFQKFKI